MRLQLIEASSGEILDSAVISGKSKWATFGGDHPQELLPELLRQYAGRLFARESSRRQLADEDGR